MTTKTATKLSAQQAFREWKTAELDMNAEKVSLKERFDAETKDARMTIQNKKAEMAAREQEMWISVQSKRERFLNIMQDADLKDGVQRKRAPRDKKNSYKVEFRLTNKETVKAVNKVPVLKKVVKIQPEKPVPNESLVKQLLADGTLALAGDHVVVTDTGEALDRYIKASLKDDDFEEVDSDKEVQ